jgi:hypothetical protein
MATQLLYISQTNIATLKKSWGSEEHNEDPYCDSDGFYGLRHAESSPICCLYS